eukprot:m.74735 g.74735  ORF g.74735 m.74735 type:complete len:178 (-) comp8067_c0_seq1:115-648(-)
MQADDQAVTGCFEWDDQAISSTQQGTGRQTKEMGRTNLSSARAMATTMGGLCLLAFFTTMGALMVILSCALPHYDNWYPMFVVLTYLFAPLPTMIARRSNDSSSSFSSGGTVADDVAVFMTAAIVVSGFGIPYVLWHNETIVAGAAWLCAGGNLVIFLTILAYFRAFADSDDSWGSF